MVALTAADLADVEAEAVRVIDLATEAGDGNLAEQVEGILAAARTRAERDASHRRTGEAAAARASNERLLTIFDATPDALLVVDPSGRIVDANRHVETLFGYTPEELIGRPVETLLPERFHHDHKSHREQFVRDPRPRSMGVGLELFARCKDGGELPVDVALGTVQGDDGPSVVAFVRDVSERRRMEELAARLREAETARAQALEINDTVVQGIVTALLRVELGDTDIADGLRATLDAARSIISDLLGERGVEPGSLVRTKPASAHDHRRPNT